MKTTTILAILLLSKISLAFDQDQPMQRGQGGRRGNEHSERVDWARAGRPNFAGNGCPAGGMQIVFAPDELSFSILFNQFVVDTTQSRNPIGDRKTCSLTVPIDLPSGMQMEITRVDYRGFTGLPQGASASLNSKIKFINRGRRDKNGGSGRGGPMAIRARDPDQLALRYNFQGPLIQDFEVSTGEMNGDAYVSPPQLSSCGGTAQLSIDTEIQVRTLPRQPAQAGLDSIDGSANSIYYVNWKRCQL